MLRGRKALVFGDDTRSFLAILRSLGRAGMEVHAAPGDLSAPALRSRYLTATHPLPLWVGDGSGWLDAVEALLRRERFDIVIPCTETALLPLAEHRARFAPLACLALPDDESIRVLFDKDATRQWAAQHGVPVAGGRALRAEDSAQSLAAEIGLPIMLKPRASHTMASLDQRGKVEMLRSIAELDSHLGRIRRAEYLVEGFFEGVGVGVSVLADQGALLAVFAHRRIRETASGGSYYRVSIPADPGMRAGVAAMLGGLRFTGVAMFEFRQNLTTGAWILLEVNARPWGSMPLPVALGVDFPAAWARLLLDGVRGAEPGYRAGLYGRNPLPDLSDLADQVRQAGSAAPGVLARRLWEFHRLLLGRERLDTLVLDDPRPGLAEFGEKFRSVLAGLWRRLPVATFQRQRRAEALALRALRRPQGDAPRLVFICAGNICRSPYAEVVLRAQLAAVAQPPRISSAGTLPRPGRPSPENGIAEAASRGFDLLAHRSAHFDRQVGEAADLIIAFDEKNLATLRARYPHLLERCVLLGDFNASGIIEDPYGGSREIYAQCYRRIDRACDALASLVIAARAEPSAQAGRAASGPEVRPA